MRLLIGAALAALTPAQAQAQEHAQVSDDGITLSFNAWSKSPTRWTVHRDGSIDDSRGAESFAATLPIDMVARHLPPAPGRYETIERLLAPVRRKVGEKLRCVTSHSDDYGGRIEWLDGVRLAYAFGCDGLDNQPIIDGVLAASQQVSTWVAGAPITRRYQITTSEEDAKQ